MSRLLFANSPLLLGMAALTIPLIIHLFLRRKRIRLPFSTLQFFIRHDDRSKNWRRLMNWLLLATRMLLLSLLVLAFARPYKPNSPASGDPRTRRHVVFALDRSASMQTLDGGVTRWSKGKAFVQQTLNTLAFEDRVALVDATSGFAPLSAWVPPQQLQKQIEQLECGFGGGDLGDGLQQAIKLFSTETLGDESTIFVVSDLQRQSCQKLDSIPIPQNIQVKVFAVGETNTPNLAISDMALPTGKNSLSATIINYSQQDAKEVALEWDIDGHAFASPSLTLPPRATTNISAPLPALTPGSHQILARLQPDDRFAPDDTRHLVLQVPAPLNVLCVEPRRVKHAFEEETFFLVSALQPETTNSLLSSFHIDKIAPEALPEKLAANARSRYQLILLPVLHDVPEASTKALLDFVQQGGGILFFAGEGLTPGQYNAAFKDLLPANLGRFEGELSAFDKSWRLTDCDSNCVVFAPFRQPGSGNLSISEFWRRCSLTPTEGAQVLARFGDQSPFLISKQLGHGRVAFLNTSANTAWSDWPKHKTFVPCLHSLCHYLAGDELTLGARIDKPWLAGGTGEVELQPGHGPKTYRVRHGKGADSALATDEHAKLQLSVPQPGFYSILDSDGQTVRIVAVNSPQRESDLSALTPGEFQQQLIHRQAVTPSGFAILDSTDGRQNFWRLLMFAGAIALLFEVILANRTYA